MALVSVLIVQVVMPSILNSVNPEPIVGGALQNKGKVVSIAWSICRFGPLPYVSGEATVITAEALDLASTAVNALDIHPTLGDSLKKASFHVRAANKLVGKYDLFQHHWNALTSVACQTSQNPSDQSIASFASKATIAGIQLALISVEFRGQMATDIIQQVLPTLPLDSRQLISDFLALNSGIPFP